MNPERWREIEQLFDQVADVPSAERDRILANADSEVRAEVEKLLLSDGQARTMLFEAVSQGEALLDEPPLQRFGPYRVIGTIGQGGMGSVYRAVRDDKVYDKEVAIKVLHLGMETPATLERFRQERQILAGLEHPHIARLIDGGETPAGLPYIVLECVEGEPITEYCEKRNLSRDERLRLFLRVCAAVEYAHHNLIVHRDLKPGNILVTSGGTPKLLDFGIAKLLDSEVQRTMTIVQAMTPDYASPEQVRGQFITTASDVYSLGVVLYELLTGKRPYSIPVMTPFEIERVVCHAEPEPPHLSEDLDNILMMALRKEPARRYASVQNLADDIERSLTNRPVVARPDTLRYRATKFVRRNRVSIVAVASVLIALGAGIVVSTLQAIRAERRFAQVRELANVFLFDLDSQIRDIPGTTKARETLVRTALRYLDSLGAEAGGDAGLQQELGIAYAKVAAVQGSPGTPSLGHTADALASYRKAIDVLRAAARSQPGTAIDDDIAETLLNMSSVEMTSGNTKTAREELETGLNLVKSGPDSDASIRRIRLTITITNKLMQNYINVGHPEQGIAPSQDAVRRARQLVERESTPESYRILGDALVMSASIRHYTGDLRAAVAGFADAVNALEEGNRRSPGRSSVSEALFWAYENTGNITGNPTDSNLGDVTAALASYRKGLALAEAAVAADAHDQTAQRRLAAACLNMADALTLVDLPEAVRYYKRMIEIMERHSHADPANLTSQRMRALGQYSLSNALLKQRSPRTAVPYITASISTLDHLTKLDSSRVYFQRDLSTAVRISGEIHLALGEDQAALTALQAAYDRARQLAEAHLADNNTVGVFADTLRSLGYFYETSRKFRDAQKARVFYAQELEIWQKWPERHTTSAFDQSRLRAARATVDRLPVK